MAATYVALFLVAPALAALPSWQQPVLDPLKPFGGSSLIPNVSSTRVFYSTLSIGTYNHAAMFAQLDGQMIVMWKNSPTDEVRKNYMMTCWCIVCWVHSFVCGTAGRARPASAVLAEF